MFKMRLVLSVVGYINLILFCYIFWNNAPQRLYGEPLAGMVVDAATGKPIPGAYVSYLWESATDPKGFFGSGGRDICYHAAGTRTDDTGRFHVDGWSKWSTYRVQNRDPQALVYAPGYARGIFMLQTGTIKPPVQRLHEVYGLDRFSGTTEQRIESLFMGFANRGCHYGGESQKSLYPMMRAMYLEVRSVAQSAEQHQAARSLGRLAASVALAPDPNGPDQSRRIQSFLEEHLQ